MADTVGGYVTSPLERFVTGVNEGWKNMQDRMDQYYKLKQDQAASDMADAAAKKPKGGSDDVTQSDQPAWVTAGGGGGGGSGGSGGSAGGAGGWGDYAAPVVNYFKSQGYSDAAIQGIMANGMAEGGFAGNWVKGDNGTSFGHWQFHQGGELGGYQQFLKDNNLGSPQDSLNQARYVDYRLGQIDPNFKNSTDPRQATNIFQDQFENPAQKSNEAPRYQYLASAQSYLANPPGPSQNATPTQVAAAAPDYSRAITMPIPSAAGLGPPGQGQAIGAPPAGGQHQASYVPQASQSGRRPQLASATAAASPAQPPGMQTASYQPSDQANFGFYGNPPTFSPGSQGTLPGYGPSPPTMAVGSQVVPVASALPYQPPDADQTIWSPQPGNQQGGGQQYALVPVNGGGLWTG